LINTETQLHFGKGQVEETYECQQCGEIKRIYEFATFNVDGSMQHSVKERSKEPQKKEPMEETVKEAPASQQPKQPEEQKQKQQEKKKRKWF